MNHSPGQILSFGKSRYVILEVSADEAALLEKCREKGIAVDEVMQVGNAAYRCQKLTVLIALSRLLSRGFTLKHTENGAPFVEGVRHVSISHCAAFAAVAVSDYEAVGIDIETLSPRVLRVRNRFLSSLEAEAIEADNVAANLVAWTSKEALFKAIPLEAIDFREHLHLRISDNGEVNSAWESRTGENMQFALHSLITKEYVMTIVTKIE